MRKANKSDKNKFINIIAESFNTNPSVNWVIKNDYKKTKRIKALADYTFECSLMKGGAFISTDETGIALCFKYNNKINIVADCINQARLAIRAIGISRVPQVLKREAYLKRQRPLSGEYLYFWFYGVTNEGIGKGAAKELKDNIFNLSEQTELPIYLETSVLKNKNVYIRYGFEVYHSWVSKDKGVTIWFMRRFPKKNITNLNCTEPDKELS